MNLFGQVLDGQQIFGLISLGLVLVLWLGVYRNNRDYAVWFKRWEADRKARREAEGDEGGDGPPSSSPRGPWG